MSSKSKGSRYERELLHKFYNAGFMPVRIAGSGSTTIPSVDLIVGKKGRVFAIECKSIKSGTKYVDSEKIKQLEFFAENFGAVPVVAMRFDRKGWFFIETKDLRKTGKGFAIGLSDAEENGKRFKELN